MIASGPPRFNVNGNNVDLSDPKIIDGDFIPEGYIRKVNGKIRRVFKGWRWEGQIIFEYLSEEDHLKLESICNSIVTGATVLFYPHIDDLSVGFEVEIDGDFPQKFFYDTYAAYSGTFKLVSKGYVNLGNISVINFPVTYGSWTPYEPDR